MSEKVRQNCVDCCRAILVDKRVEKLTNVCGDCVRKYKERFGVRRPVAKKPKRG